MGVGMRFCLNKDNRIFHETTTPYTKEYRVFRNLCTNVKSYKRLSTEKTIFSTIGKAFPRGKRI